MNDPFCDTSSLSMTFSCALTDPAGVCAAGWSPFFDAVNVASTSASASPDNPQISTNE